MLQLEQFGRNPYLMLILPLLLNNYPMRLFVGFFWSTCFGNFCVLFSLKCWEVVFSCLWGGPETGSFLYGSGKSSIWSAPLRNRRWRSLCRHSLVIVTVTDVTGRGSNPRNIYIWYLNYLLNLNLHQKTCLVSILMIKLKDRNSYTHLYF